MCTWLRHFIGAEKAHADSQSRHMSHLIAGWTLRQAAWTCAKILHQFVQGGAHTVRRSQTRSKLYPAEPSGSKGAQKMRPSGSYLMHFTGLDSHSPFANYSPAAFPAVKFTLQDLKYVSLVIQDNGVSLRRQCSRRHQSSNFCIFFLGQL